MMSPPRTPKKKIVRKWRDTPIPRREVKPRCKEIEPKLFYSPIKKAPPSGLRPRRMEPLPMLPESSEDEEPRGQCLECGTAVSAHAQLCGKTRCLTPKLQEEDPKSEPAPEEEAAIECEPFLEWKTRQLRYPHSMSGEPLHDLVAAMLHVDREACVRFYDKTLGV